MEEELIALLKKTEALITGDHLVGTSGRHMSVYVNKDMLLTHTADTSRVGELFAQKNKELSVDVVVGPAMGAIILAQWTAYHLSRLTGKEVLSVYTEKTPLPDGTSGQVFKRGYDKIVEGKNVLIVEDTTTTGGSVVKVAETVKAAGGNVVQLCVMVNRDPATINSETLGWPFSWLASVPAESYPEDACPLCANGVPVNTSVGHGKKFMDKKGA